MTTEAEKKAQEERAKRLHRQISSFKEKLSSGTQPIENPRDFIAEKMNEFENEQSEDFETKNEQDCENPEESLFDEEDEEDEEDK